MVQVFFFIVAFTNYYKIKATTEYRIARMVGSNNLIDTL